MSSKRIAFAIKIVVALSIVIFMIVASLPERSSDDTQLPHIVFARQASYALAIGFDVHIITNGVIVKMPLSPIVWVPRYTDPDSPYFNPLLTAFVFVESAKSEISITNGIVGWPADEICLEGWIKGFHWAASIENVDFRGNPRPRQIKLEYFGLIYPLTIEDLLNNWEKIRALYSRLSTAELHTIWNWAILGNQSIP